MTDLQAILDKGGPWQQARIIGGQLLIQGDCLEVMAVLPKVDACLTDPPYVGLKGGFNHYQTHNLAPSRAVTAAVGDPWGASTEWLEFAKRIATRCIVSFCGYSDVATLKQEANLPGWLVTWAFNNSAPSMRNAPWFRNEFAWVLKTGKGTWRNIPTVIHHPKLNAGCAGSPERVLNQDGTASHPTQKPVAVVSQLIIPEAETILDPFMGSGTTLVACQRLGRQGIGIELDPDYWEIACKRVQEVVNNPPLFIPEQPKPTQEALDL